MIFKFKNGDQIAIPIADQSSGYLDVIGHLKAINKKNSPIEVVMGNGETYVSSGKELISVELMFE